MKEKKRIKKHNWIGKLFLMSAAIFLSSLISGWGGVKKVEAAEPILTYKDEAVYNIGGQLKDKQGRYLLPQGGSIKLVARQSVYGLITAVDWGTDSVGGWAYISLVGGKPKVEDVVQGVIVRGVRPGLVTLNGRILSTSMYDVQWCDNKFPIRVVGPLTAITLTDSSLSLSPGGTAEIGLETMTPDSLYSLLFSTPITYTSSNPSVATVGSSDGKITAVSGGTATVTATTRNGVRASCKVTVKGKSSGTSTGSSKGLSLNKSRMTIPLGRKGKLKATLNGKTITPVYKGGKKNISISKNGIITAKKIGTVTVKATYKKKTVVCRVTVVPAALSLKASAGTNKVTLKWKKASKISGYKVYRSSAANGKYEEVKTLKASKKGITLKNHAKGTYYYKVRSYKKVRGKTYLGALSKAKKVRVK